MAKIVCEYDTETKALSLTIDGEAKQNVECVNFCSYSEENEEYVYGNFEASFKNIEENGVKYRLRAMGSEIQKSNAIEDYVREKLTKK